MDPSELDGTYKIWIQQTWFDWDCSWELVESATTLVPPCSISEQAIYHWLWIPADFGSVVLLGRW